MSVGELWSSAKKESKSANNKIDRRLGYLQAKADPDRSILSSRILPRKTSVGYEKCGIVHCTSASMSVVCKLLELGHAGLGHAELGQRACPNSSNLHTTHVAISAHAELVVKRKRRRDIVSLTWEVILSSAGHWQPSATSNQSLLCHAAAFPWTSTAKRTNRHE